MTVDLSFTPLGVPEAEGDKGATIKALKQLIKGNPHMTHLDLSWNNFRTDVSRNERGGD